MKTVMTIAMILAAASAAAVEPTAVETRIGDETVTVRIAAGSCSESEMNEQYDLLRANPAADKREQIVQRLWECGNAEALGALAEFREQSGDATGAYAYWLAFAEYAKLNARVGDRKGQEAAWDRVQVPFYAGIHREAARIAKRLSASQKADAQRQAARIINDNPYCCLPM